MRNALTSSADLTARACSRTALPSATRIPRFSSDPIIKVSARSTAKVSVLHPCSRNVSWICAASAGTLGIGR